MRWGLKGKQEKWVQIVDKEKDRQPRPQLQQPGSMRAHDGFANRAAFRKFGSRESRLPLRSFASALLFLPPLPSPPAEASAAFSLPVEVNWNPANRSTATYGTETQLRVDKALKRKRDRWVDREISRMELWRKIEQIIVFQIFIFNNRFIGRNYSPRLLNIRR